MLICWSFQTGNQWRWSNTGLSSIAQSIKSSRLKANFSRTEPLLPDLSVADCTAITKTTQSTVLLELQDGGQTADVVERATKWVGGERESVSMDMAVYLGKKKHSDLIECMKAILWGRWMTLFEFSQNAQLFSPFMVCVCVWLRVCVRLLKYYQHLPALVVIISDRLGNITVEQHSGVEKTKNTKNNGAAL